MESLEEKRIIRGARSTWQIFGTAKPWGLWGFLSPSNICFFWRCWHHCMKLSQVVGDTVVRARCIMYHVCILGPWKEHNHTLSCIKDLYVHCGKFPADGTQVSFLTKKLIWGTDTFSILHKIFIRDTGNSVFQ